MLEWLEVRLDVGCDKRLVYETALNCWSATEMHWNIIIIIIIIRNEYYYSDVSQNKNFESA